MRPNLMSPRRTSGEDSILAMLERDPARKRGSGRSAARLAWYGGGAAMALALVGALVWLAANNDGMRPNAQEMALAEAGKAAQQQPAGVALIQVAMAPPALELRRTSAAVIVDQAPPPDGVPPLRLLKPAPPKAAAPARVPAPDALPARPLAKTAAPPRPAPAPAPAAKQAARPAPAPARVKPVLAAKNTNRPGQAKAQRGTPPVKAADGAPDADVALISAVILHANGHAPEGSQMTELLCPNNACQSKPAQQ
ncbi:hypothetical protein [Massilia yuzhufengensis]|nr:hypothetical protein [Massilia yuzhufengensis]